MATNTIPMGTTAKPRGEGGKRQKPLVGMSQYMDTELSMPIQTEHSRNLAKINQMRTKQTEEFTASERQAELDYQKRLLRAEKEKASGTWWTGIDPVELEKRITVAERQDMTPQRRENVIEGLRTGQYEPSALQNVGSLLKRGGKGIGHYLQGLGHQFGIGRPSMFPGFAASGRPMKRGRIQRGEGSFSDILKYGGKTAKELAGQPEFLTEVGQVSKRSQLEPLADPLEKQAAKDLLASLYTPSDPSMGTHKMYMPPQRRGMEFGEMRGEGEGEKKETFNLLKLLMGLLGLPFKVLGLGELGQDEGDGRQPRRTLPTPQFQSRISRPIIGEQTNAKR
jgi:hypothetical protein